MSPPFKFTSCKKEAIEVCIEADKEEIEEAKKKFPDKFPTPAKIPKEEALILELTYS